MTRAVARVSAHAQTLFCMRVLDIPVTNVQRALSLQSNAVRAFASQAPATSQSDFEALAAVIDSDEGRRQLAGIRAQFIEAQNRLEELDSQVGPGRSETWWCRQEAELAVGCLPRRRQMGSDHCYTEATTEHLMRFKVALRAARVVRVLLIEITLHHPMYWSVLSPCRPAPRLTGRS